MRTDFSSQAYFRNPAHELARLRAAGPVVEIEFPLIGKTWTTTTQEMADRVLKDSVTFTIRRDDGAIVVDTGNATIRFHSQRSLAARFRGVDLGGAATTGLVGLALRTTSLAKAEHAIAAGGVRAAPTADGIAVAPGDACGVLLVFAGR